LQYLYFLNWFPGILLVNSIAAAKSIDALIADISGVTGALQNAVAVSNLRRAVQGPGRRVGRVGFGIYNVLFLQRL